MPNGNATIESRRFGVEIEVEGISTDRARRELRLPTGWKVTSDGSLHDGCEVVPHPLNPERLRPGGAGANLLKRHGDRVSELTFQALERRKRRHARSWPELTLKGIVRAFGQASEEDAADCRQVEAELRGEVTVVQAEPSGAVAAPAETVAEATEPGEVSEAPVAEEMPPVEAPALPVSNEEPQKLVAAVVSCKGCGQRMTRGTMMVRKGLRGTIILGARRDNGR